MTTKARSFADRAKELETRNDERRDRFAAQGFGINPVQTRIISYLETLLGDRLELAELAYQEKLSDELDTFEKQLTRARLGVK